MTVAAFGKIRSILIRRLLPLISHANPNGFSRFRARSTRFWRRFRMVPDSTSNSNKCRRQNSSPWISGYQFCPTFSANSEQNLLILGPFWRESWGNHRHAKRFKKNLSPIPSSLCYDCIRCPNHRRLILRWNHFLSQWRCLPSDPQSGTLYLI